jgi:uncharacterized cupin superfamily protein
VETGSHVCKALLTFAAGRTIDVPKINTALIPVRKGVGYPKPFADLTAHRLRQKLGDAGGLTDFGVNLTRLPPGEWSSQRHWHSHEDEFVLVLEGELVLIEDDGDTTLCAGDAAAFQKGSGNGHHMINKSDCDAVYLEIGSRKSEDVIMCSDIDMMSTNADGRFLHKDGTPFIESESAANGVASESDDRRRFPDEDHP